MLGILLFFSTIANIPYWFRLIPVIWVVFKRKDILFKNVACNQRFLVLFVLFILGCILNNIFHGLTSIPNVYMNIPMLLCAFALNQKDLRCFVVLTLLECFVGMYEYHLGISSILSGSIDDFEDGDYLYFKRVSGLSVGSSIFSQKIMFSTIFLLFFKGLFSKKVILCSVVICFVGLFTTFNRTSLGIAMLCLGIYLCREYKSEMKKNVKYGAFILLMVLPLLFYLFEIYGGEIFNQFTRGNTDTALTGRPYIWAKFIAFIIENPLFGNGSVRLLVSRVVDVIHAHNSFLQLIADHGLILSSIFLINIFIKINKYNLLCCVLVFLSSLTQYTIFWGFSVADVFFFAILCNVLLYRSPSLQHDRTNTAKTV